MGESATWSNSSYKNGKTAYFGNISNKNNFKYMLYTEDGVLHGELEKCNKTIQDEFYCTYYKTENALRIILKDIKLLLESICLK